MAQLALYKGRGKVGNALIRWWTESQYSHCEIVIDGVGYSSSLMDGGVRCKRINFDSDKWDLVDLPDWLGRRALAHFQETRGQRYSWLDLIRAQILNRRDDEPGAAFCSEWCAAALGLPEPTSYSPRTLASLLTAILSAPWRTA